MPDLGMNQTMQGQSVYNDTNAYTRPNSHIKKRIQGSVFRHPVLLPIGGSIDISVKGNWNI